MKKCMENENEKVKALFLINEGIRESSGISKKIICQFNAFRKNKIEIELCYLEMVKNLAIRKINDEVLAVYPQNMLGKLKRKRSYNEIYEYIIENHMSFIYIRYSHFSNISFLNFLKKLKNERIKVLLEIPTFPYDLEYRNLTNIVKLEHFYEKITRKYFLRYIYKVVTFSNDDTIFKCPTIKISNAIDLENIPLKQEIYFKENINFIGVAGLTFWHGYDRLIQSIGKHHKINSNIDVHFHIVGDGDEKIPLMELAQKLGIQDKIIFHGTKSGKDLDEIYNVCHVAVDSLGRHRSGNNYNNSLKSKEYVARGIPFIKSHIDISIEGEKFYKDVSANEESINIAEILNWYLMSDFNAHNIRNYAENNLTWDIQIQKILDKI